MSGCPSAHYDKNGTDLGQKLCLVPRELHCTRCLKKCRKRRLKSRCLNASWPSIGGVTDFCATCRRREADNCAVGNDRYACNSVSSGFRVGGQTPHMRNIDNQTVGASSCHFYVKNRFSILHLQLLKLTGSASSRVLGITFVFIRDDGGGSEEDDSDSSLGGRSGSTVDMAVHACLLGGRVEA
jgi:hypothetical protein